MLIRLFFVGFMGGLSMHVDGFGWDDQKRSNLASAQWQRYHGDNKQGRTRASLLCRHSSWRILSIKAGGKVNTLRDFAVFSKDCYHLKGASVSLQD